MSDGRDFVRLVSEFKLHLHLTFLIECHFFILPHLVHLDTLVKHLLHVLQQHHSIQQFVNDNNILTFTINVCLP